MPYSSSGPREKEGGNEGIEQIKENIRHGFGFALLVKSTALH